MQLQADGVIFDFDVSELKGESLAFKEDESCYEVFVDAEGEKGSWHDVESGLTAILFEDGLRGRYIGRSVRSIVANVVEMSDDLILVAHKLCVRVELFNGQDDLYRVSKIKTVADDRTWSIG